MRIEINKKESLIDIVRHPELDDKHKIDKIKASLEAKTGDLLERGESGISVIHEACLNGGVELIQWLLQMKPELINAVSVYGTNVLCYALKYANKPLVDYFLQHAPHLMDVINKNELTPMNFAAMGGDFSLFLKLFKKFNVNLRKTVVDKIHPVGTAIEDGKLDFIKSYLQAEKEQDLPPFDITSIAGGLLHAKINKHQNILDWCAEQGFEVVSPTDEEIEKARLKGGEFQFRLGIKFNFSKFKLFKGKKLVDLFIDFNMLNVASDDGHYPLHVVTKNNDLEAVAALLDRGVSIEQADDTKWKNRPLLIAVREGHHALVEYLIQRGAKINVPNAKGRYPIHSAAEYGYLSILKSLLVRGVDPNQQERCEYGNTPLFVAASFSDTNTLELLWEHKAEIDKPMTSGWYPIHAAIAENKVDNVRWLLEHGADPNRPMKNSSGDTPLLLALEHKNLEIVQLLLDKKADLISKDSKKIQPKQVKGVKESKETTNLMILDNDPDDLLKDEVKPIEGRMLIAAAKDKRFLFILEKILSTGVSLPSDINLALSAAAIANNIDAVRCLLKHNAKITEDCFEGFSEFSRRKMDCVLCGNFELFKLLFDSTSDSLAREKLIFLLCGEIHLALSYGGDKHKWHVTTFREVKEAINPAVLALIRNSLPEHRFIEFSKQYIKNFKGDKPVLQQFIDLLKEDKLFPSIVAEFVNHDFNDQAVFMLENLIEAKASAQNLNVSDYLNRTPAFYVARKGHWPIVSYLIKEYHIDLTANADMKGSGGILLHAACEGGHLHVVKNLIELKANPCIADKEGNWPAFYAARYNHSHILSYFKNELNINPAAQFQSGKNLIHAACEGGHLVLVKELIELKVNPNEVDNKGNTPAYYAAMHGHWHVLSFLITEYHISLDRQYGLGKTLLHAAIEGRHTELVKNLIDLKANPSIADAEGFTPMATAVAYNQPKVIRILAISGVDINTPINVTSQEGVITEPHSYDERTVNINTLLGLAANGGCMSTIRELMDLGVDPGQFVEPGVLAWEKAVHNRHYKAAAFLYQSGSQKRNYWDTGHPLYSVGDLLVAGLAESDDPEMEYKKIEPSLIKARQQLQDDDHVYYARQLQPFDKLLDQAKAQHALKATIPQKRRLIADLPKAAALLAFMAGVRRHFVFPQVGDRSIHITDLCLSFLLPNGLRIQPTTFLRAMQDTQFKSTSKFEWNTNLLRKLNLVLLSPSQSPAAVPAPAPKEPESVPSPTATQSEGAVPPR